MCTTLGFVLAVILCKKTHYLMIPFQGQTVEHHVSRANSRPCSGMFADMDGKRSGVVTAAEANAKGA